ncbi:MAG TPA: amylo-alpha-1,6-glucosidase [Bryobacteraceae bacterium]|nr:amylo-alpha-1,6-glucosidase [Bryobacteraceae bacterium]
MIVPGATCRDFDRSSKIEWLETNGTGAFAMGTVAGVNTRRYHGLLVASLHPPVQRNVLLSRIEEEINGHALGACQYPGAVTPRGFEFVEQFETHPCATWRFGVDGVRVEKQVYLIEGRQAAIIRYRSDRAVTLRARPFLAYRDYHSLGHARADLFGGLPRIEFHHTGRFEESAQWYYNVEYLVELDRGLDFREDLFTPGVIVLDLKPGEWTPICVSIDGPHQAEPTPRDEPFTVHRADGTPTIIAGYPWFTDWGRDTMISLPGLLIARGKLDTAREIIAGFLEHISQGLIPNRFPDAGDAPEYNTADATLWMFQAMRALGDREFFRKTFYPAAKNIVDWHFRGTWFGIGVDPEDHLLRAGTPGTQLTWMDAKVGDWVVTPRHGKAVEINALWHAALSLMADWGESGEYQREADLVKASFRRKFWNAERGCLYDLLTDSGPVAKFRPNQIFGVGLLAPDEQRSVVRAVERELLTPVGLRTLEHSDPEYKGRYQGSPVERDGAYHQGTVWPWLLGPYVDAYLSAFGPTDQNLEYCAGLVDRLEAAGGGCLGSIPEIYDGDEPHRAGGCPAQAWSVAEALRIRSLLRQAHVPK